MAPRAKSKANRQLGSSSFDRTRFWKEETEHKYDEIWILKPVVIERYWQIDQFRNEDFMLEQNFEGRQWLNIAKFHAYCIVDVVREFFANFKEGSVIRRKGRERLISWVRGIEITVTPEDFAQVFQLPRVQNPEFTYPAVGTPPFSTIVPEIVSEGQEWVGEYRKPASILKDKYWAIHMFSCTNLLPQNRNSDCTPTRARLIYAIGMGMTIDLPSYIWHQVAYACERSGALTALPFGGALTEIFRRKGATIPEDMPITSGLQPFNMSSHAKSRGLLHKKKRKIEEQEEGGTSHTPEEAEETQGDGDEELADQIGALADRISQIEQNQEEDHQLLLRIHQSQQTQEHLLQSVLDHIRESYPPPPPQ